MRFYIKKCPHYFISTIHSMLLPSHSADSTNTSASSALQCSCAFTYEDTSSPANTRTPTCSDVAFRGSCVIHDNTTPETNELDLDWIREEETLLSLSELLPNTPLSTIRVQFLFVDVSSSVHLGMVSFPSLEIDTNTNHSILPKNTLNELIERAIHNMHLPSHSPTRIHPLQRIREPLHAPMSHSAVLAHSVSSSGSAGSDVSSRVFSLDDILIWNHNVDSDHILQYAESCSPNWISTEFIHGSISQDIGLTPSIAVLHSIQTIYVILRETPPPPRPPPPPPSHSILRKDAGAKNAKTSNKLTKRVRFSTTLPSNSTTRKRGWGGGVPP